MLYWSKIIEGNWVLNSGIRIIIFFSNLLNKILRKYKPGNNSITIISLHKLGDSVFNIPIIKKILNDNKNEINLFCLQESLPIYQLIFGNSINFYAFSIKDFRFGDRVSGPEIRKCFRKRDSSLIIDLTGSPKSASLIMFNRADKIVGFNQNIFKSLYTNFNSVYGFTHISNIYAKAVNDFLKIDTNNLLQNFKIERKKIGDIIIHPFAGWSAKEWGIHNFILLAEKLNNIRTVKIIAADHTIPDEVKEEINQSGLKFIETKTVNELIDNLRNASMVIGNDSGPVYIANLMGIPSFTLFGPSNPSFHFIPSKYSGFINAKLRCSPNFGEKLCFTNGGRDGCPLNICMDSINVDTVYKKIINVLEIN